MIALNMDLVLVFLTLIFILLVLYKEWLGPSFTFVVAIGFLGITGVLTPSEILHGFANEQVAVIILLLLLGDVIRRTNVIENVFDKLFLSAKTYKGFLSRMVAIVAGFSAFLNNTPLVAIMMPYVHSWCKKNNYSPSKFLMPLSYAAILGGNITLIGTSTNLIVNGYVTEEIVKNPIIGLKELNIFDFAPVGLAMTVLGFLYLLFSERLLPNRKALTEDVNNNTREYLIEAKVRQNSNMIGQTIEEAGLRNLRGLFLVEIIRGSTNVSPVGPNVIIDKDDILIFAGDTEKIVDLLGSKSGLSLPEVGMLTKRKKTEVLEIVVSQNSTIIGKTVREINFRGKYDAAIIAVHRNGERIAGKIGQVVLKAGDVLLLYTGEDFHSLTSHTQDFYFMQKIKDFTKLEWYKIVALLGGTTLAILLSAFHVMSLFMGLLIVILLCLALKITNPKVLPKSIDYNLGLIIVLSLALGTAMVKSGAADLIANWIINLFLPMGKIGLLFGIYLIATFLAAYITNKAAVGIIFPISLSMATSLNLNPMPFVLIVAYACAANFMTPIGYQTNLMVYGPGGYTFKDFFKVGFPLTIIYMCISVWILSAIYF
jgi:di/tricarboxylate transporter